MKYWLTIFAALLATAAARPIEGQVFVVIGSGQAIKLAGVEITILTPAQVAEMARSAEMETAMIKQQFAVKNASIEREFKKLRDDALEAAKINVERAERILAEKKRSGTKSEISNAEFNLNEERKNFSTQSQSLDDIFRSRFDSNRRDLEKNAVEKMMDVRFIPPPMPAAKTRSDADGMFSVEAPTKSAILIRTVRQIGSGRETLRWFLWVDKLPPGKILFGNHNWVGGDPDGQVIELSRQAGGN